MTRCPRTDAADNAVSISAIQHLVRKDFNHRFRSVPKGDLGRTLRAQNFQIEPRRRGATSTKERQGLPKLRLSGLMFFTSRLSMSSPRNFSFLTNLDPDLETNSLSKLRATVATQQGRSKSFHTSLSDVSSSRSRRLRWGPPSTRQALQASCHSEVAQPRTHPLPTGRWLDRIRASVQSTGPGTHAHNKPNRFQVSAPIQTEHMLPLAAEAHLQHTRVPSRSCLLLASVR